jgi:hypothetical protein
VFERKIFFNFKLYGKLVGLSNKFEPSMVFDPSEFEGPRFDLFSINEDRIWHFQQRILQNINVFSKISKESTSCYHIHEKYSVSSTFLYNGNSKCYVVRILYAIAFQWSKCFGYRGQQIILKLTITDSRCWQSGSTMTWILISGLSCNKLSH